MSKQRMTDSTCEIVVVDDQSCGGCGGGERSEDV